MQDNTTNNSISNTANNTQLAGISSQLNAMVVKLQYIQQYALNIPVLTAIYEPSASIFSISVSNETIWPTTSTYIIPTNQSTANTSSNDANNASTSPGITQIPTSIFAYKQNIQITVPTGPVGPAGKTGNQGATGKTGVKGIQGPPGKQGIMVSYM